jgi:ubiquinone/menaquinone biosynthesis C-methylase UbiE
MVSRHYSQLGQSGESKALHGEHISNMRDYYARTAEQYNAWHCDASNDSCHNCAVSQIMDLLLKDKTQTLLDVGWGTGRCIRVALDLGIDVQGIALLPELLAVARTQFKIPADRLHCGDATNLPFASNSYNTTCVLGALHHSARPHTIIAEI